MFDWVLWGQLSVSLLGEEKFLTIHQVLSCRDQTANPDFPFWRILVNTIISHFQQHTGEVGTISGEYFWCYCFDWSKIRQRNKAGIRLASDSICCLHVQGQLICPKALGLPAKKKHQWGTEFVSPSLQCRSGGTSGGSTHRGDGVRLFMDIFTIISSRCALRWPGRRFENWFPCAWCLQGLQQPHLATWQNTFLEFLCLALYPSLFPNFTLGSSTSLEKRKSPKGRPKHSKY